MSCCDRSRRVAYRLTASVRPRLAGRSPRLRPLSPGSTVRGTALRRWQVGMLRGGRSPGLTRKWRDRAAWSPASQPRKGLPSGRPKQRAGCQGGRSATRTHPHARSGVCSTRAGPTMGFGTTSRKDANDLANEPRERCPPPGPGHDAPSSDRCNGCRPLEWVGLSVRVTRRTGPPTTSTPDPRPGSPSRASTSGCPVSDGPAGCDRRVLNPHTRTFAQLLIDCGRIGCSGRAVLRGAGPSQFPEPSGGELSHHSPRLLEPAAESAHPPGYPPS
jgi:hypothetical protein